MPIFSSFVAIFIFLNCQRQDFTELLHLCQLWKKWTIYHPQAGQLQGLRKPHTHAILVADIFAEEIKNAQDNEKYE